MNNGPFEKATLRVTRSEVTGCFYHRPKLYSLLGDHYCVPLKDMGIETQNSPNQLGSGKAEPEHGVWKFRSAHFPYKRFSRIGAESKDQPTFLVSSPHFP